MQRIFKFNKNCSKRSIRNISTIKGNNYHEEIIERSDYPLDKCRKKLCKDLISVLGYGPQGRGQALNLRDNGFNVNVGVRKGNSWDNALRDGWEPDIDLFEIDEAAYNGSIIKYLLSDYAQTINWDVIKSNLHENDTLYFSHGFGIVYNDKTKIIPPKNIDVVMVAPKGSGLTVRNHFLNGSGINCSFAVYQDYTKKARERCLSLAFGIGCGHAFETTFEKEVYSDLTGERCVLMGLIQGAFLAQYNVLRENGHSASEAYNETVEEALDSLYPLINDRGMDWLYSNCSTTAQRGALDWAKVFERELKPSIDKCYRDVVVGIEAEKAIKTNSNPNYRNKLNQELEDINNQEIWQTAKIMRKYRV